MKNRLLLSYGALVLAVLVALGVPLGATFARAERRELTERVQHDALSLALRSADQLRTGQHESLQAIAVDYTQRTGARVVLTDATGISVADSDTDLPIGRNFATRPEIAAALRGEEAAGTRRSDTLDEELLYVAEPVATGGRIHGAVRVTYPTSFVRERIWRVWALLGAIGVLVLGFAMLLATALARSLSAPLADLAGTARQLGGGDLSARADTTASLPEVALLASVLNETATRLEQLVSRQRDFVAQASHQLRSPLAALRLRLENLEDDLDGGHAESVAASLREVQRLSRLVDGLLALARIDEADAAPEPVALASLVAERIEVWEPYATERSVRLLVEAERPVTACATAGHLEQVLDNLIANALEVAPVDSSVTVQIAERGARVELRVVDNGPGMTAEDRERAFDRFWRSPQAKSAGGTGLGLAIVQRLVTSDGGEVTLEAAPGGGLAAVVRLRRP